MAAQEKMAWFIFLLFPRSDILNRSDEIVSGIQSFRVIDGDPMSDESARWAELRRTLNSDDKRLEDVAVLYDDGPGVGSSEKAAHNALMGAKCAITAELRNRLEAAEKGGA